MCMCTMSVRHKKKEPIKLLAQLKKRDWNKKIAHPLTLVRRVVRLRDVQRVRYIERVTTVLLFVIHSAYNRSDYKAIDSPVKF